MSKFADLVAAIVLGIASIGLVIAAGMLAIATIGSLLTRPPPVARPRHRP